MFVIVTKYYTLNNKHGINRKKNLNISGNLPLFMCASAIKSLHKSSKWFQIISLAATVLWSWW